MHLKRVVEKKNKGEILAKNEERIQQDYYKENRDEILDKYAKILKQSQSNIDLTDNEKGHSQSLSALGELPKKNQSDTARKRQSDTFKGQASDKRSRGLDPS